MKSAFQSLATVAFLGSLQAETAQADSMYNAIKSEVSIYNAINFPKQVLNNREKGISIVQFYKGSEEASKRDKGQYEKFSIENKGMFRIGSVNCEDFGKLCDKESVSQFPSYKIYPPVPAPVVDFPFSDAEVDTEKLKKKAFPYIGNRVIEITQQNIDTFKKDNPGMPKLLLFSDKKTTPMVYRALSTYFDQTLEFGIVRQEETALAKIYGVKSYPKVFLLKNNDKPLAYEGTSFLYKDLFEWINIYSETFVFVGDMEKKEKTSSASKPWMNMAVPYMTSDSGNDICLKKDGTLCVIYIVPSKDKSQEKVVDAMVDLQQGFASKIERGISFNFVRLDVSLEPEFSAMFGADSAPKMVVLNPGKRKRYLLHEGELTSGDVEKTLDKILGGDARFKGLKDFKTLASSYDMYIQ